MFGLHFSRQWKWPKVVVGLMVAELMGTVGCLVLFGVASPNTYRTAMWQIGADNGFNSSPLQILYAYANYQPIPKIPMVWSSLYVLSAILFHLFQQVPPRQTEQGNSANILLPVSQTSMSLSPSSPCLFSLLSSSCS